MAFQLSDNGLAAFKEVGRWIVAVCAVFTLWIQSHYQHVERIAELKKANESNEAKVTELKAIKTAVESRRPLVFEPK